MAHRTGPDEIASGEMVELPRGHVDPAHAACGVFENTHRYAVPGISERLVPLAERLRQTARKLVPLRRQRVHLGHAGAVRRAESPSCDSLGCSPR